MRKTCWLYLGSKGPKGYGLVLIDGRHKQAHRVSYESKYGKIQDGLLACHKCDTPMCINPNHIFIGTYHQNTLDAIRKGRRPVARDARPIQFNLSRKLIKRLQNIAKKSNLSMREVLEVCLEKHLTI